MKRITIGFLCFVTIFFGVMAFTKSEESKSYQPFQALHSNTFFDSRYFTQEPPEVEEAPSTRIYGTVVPHHLLAYKLIAQIFCQLEVQKPPLIILIGPNHFNQGDRIVTSAWGWQTPFGVVEADSETVDHLVGTNLVKVDDSVFVTEHSMGNLMPFIKYYLPEAKVVPIIFHHDLTKEEAVLLSQELANLAEEKEAVIMASIDFSHYLTNKEAQLKDEETLEVIKTKNIARLLTLGDANLDSPGALATMLLTMEKLRVEDLEVLQHTNSGLLIGNNLIETTSYMTFVFR